MDKVVHYSYSVQSRGHFDNAGRRAHAAMWKAMRNRAAEARGGEPEPKAKLSNRWFDGVLHVQLVNEGGYSPAEIERALTEAKARLDSRMGDVQPKQDLFTDPKAAFEPILSTVLYVGGDAPHLMVKMRAKINEGDETKQLAFQSQFDELARNVGMVLGASERKTHSARITGSGNRNRDGDIIR